MIRCPLCKRWTPSINGMCSTCYEESLPEIDESTRRAIDFVRAQERQVDGEEKPAE